MTRRSRAAAVHRESHRIVGYNRKDSPANPSLQCIFAVVVYGGDRGAKSAVEVFGCFFFF
uniref:Uncharacterized protein n=1 Tax=Anopheles albimanus TaxID=7167 RepID=A0A182FXS4_ANOAL